MSSRIKERIQETYDRQARRYDATRQFWEEGYGGMRERQLSARYLSGSWVLYLACGTGRHVGMLIRRFNVIGIDLSRNMLLTAKSKHRSVELLAADAERLPFKDGMFDGVVCSRAIIWFPKPRHALQEANRCLRASGVCIVSSDTNDPLWVQLSIRLGIPKDDLERDASLRYHSTHLASMLQSSNLHDVSTRCITYLFPHAYFLPTPLVRMLTKLERRLRAGRNTLIIGFRGTSRYHTERRANSSKRLRSQVDGGASLLLGLVESILAIPLSILWMLDNRYAQTFFHPAHRKLWHRLSGKIPE